MEEGAYPFVENKYARLDTDIFLPFIAFEKCDSFGFNFV